MAKNSLPRVEVGEDQLLRVPDTRRHKNLQYFVHHSNWPLVELPQFNLYSFPVIVFNLQWIIKCHFFIINV